MGLIVGGVVVIVLLVLLNIVGVKEAKLNVLLAVIDFATQALLVVLGFVLIFSPDDPHEERGLGIAPTWSSSSWRSRSR